MGIESLARGATLSYEQNWAQKEGVDKVLFTQEDSETSSAIKMDLFVGSPYAIAYRSMGGESHVRQYDTGSSYLYYVPTASEKTRVGEVLRDAVALGLEATDEQDKHTRKIMDDIVKQHVAAHRITKWKQALDVIFDSKFYALGPNGQSIGLDIDFERAAGNSLNPHTVVSKKIATALKEMQDKIISQGSPTSSLIVIMGDNYQRQLYADQTIGKYIYAYESNYLLMQDLYPKVIGNKDSGLVIHSLYRGERMVAPVALCSYSPGVSYIQTKGGSAESWVPTNKAAMFSLDSPTFHFQRGINVIDESRNVRRTAGDIVFDAFSENDPVATYIRSQTRHAYIFGNSNHVAVDTITP